MADNLTLNAGSGGSDLATDDVGGIHYQITKTAFGALDAAVLAIAGAGNVTTGTQRVTIASDDVNAAAIKAALETVGGLVVNLGANNDVTVTGTVDLGATDNAVLDAIVSALSGTLTVSGTVTANLGATDNAVLDAIAASAALLDDAVYVDDADWTDGTSKHLLTGGLYQSTPQTVTDGDVAPFNITANGALHVAQQGTVTVDLGSNNDVTVTGTVDLGATDNGVLDAIAASVAAIDTDATTIIGHVDGIETVLGTIDTDTGNIATSVAALDDIVLAEDAVHQTGDKGVMALGVRQSSQADFGADGDYVPMSIDDDGGLRVSIVAGAGSGGTAAADDADFTAGTTSGTPAMGVYESSPTSVTDGDLGTVGITQTRALRTAVEGSVTVDLGANNDVTVTGTVDLGATDNAVLDAIAASVAAIDTDATTIIGHVDGIEAVLGTIDADTGSMLTALQLIDNNAVAHDGAASAIGVGMIGLEARNTEPTAVSATGDAVRALATMLGKQVVMPYAIPASTWQYASVSGGVTDTSDDVAKAAAGTNIRNYITHCSVVNGHATVSTEVVIKDGSTVIWRGFAQAAGGGISERFDPPLRGSANTAVNVTNITTGSATYFNLQGYVALE